MGVVLVGSGGYIGQEFAARLTASLIKYCSIDNRQMFDSLSEDFWKNTHEDTTIIWAAGQANSHQKILTPDIVNSESVRFKKFVNEISALNVKSIRVLFMSSGGAIYRDFTTPPSETDKLTESNTYGLLKLYMETLLFQNGINHVSLRLGNVYGPKIDKQFGVIAKWARCIRDGEKIHLTESVHSQRDYIHISDVLDFSFLLMNSTFEGPINVATGKSTSLAQILEWYDIHNSELLVDSYSKNEKDTKEYSQGALNVLLANETFDWRSKVSLYDGIREILSDLR